MKKHTTIIIFSLIILSLFSITSISDYNTQGIPGIYSIDGSGNETTLFNTTPPVNWTIEPNTSEYWLQISNNSDFTNLTVNLTDINKYNYPTYFSTNATHVTFQLPPAYALENLDDYYIRVQANEKD